MTLKANPVTLTSYGQALLKQVPPACKEERTMRWRGRPPIGGQDSDRVSHRCSAPYTLLPLRGISPQGETRNLRRKTESYIPHVPLRHSTALSPVGLSLPERSDAQRTHFEGAERRTKCSESFPLWGHNLPPTGGHNPRGQGPRQPSRRRRVQSEPYAPGPQSGPNFLLFLHFSYRIML